MNKMSLIIYRFFIAVIALGAVIFTSSYHYKSTEVQKNFVKKIKIWNRSHK